MKFFKNLIIIVFVLLFIIINNDDGIVNCQSNTESTTPTPTDDDTFCSGNTSESCISAQACCFWCGHNSTAGVCLYESTLLQCSTNVMTELGDKCQGYSITTCKCNFRNQTNSAFSLSLNIQNNNSLIQIITIASIVLIIITYLI